MIGHHTISVTPVEWPESSPVKAEGEHVDDYMARLDAQEGHMYWKACITLFDDDTTPHLVRHLRTPLFEPELRRLYLRKMWQSVKKALQEIPTADILPSP